MDLFTKIKLHFALKKLWNDFQMMLLKQWGKQPSGDGNTTWKEDVFTNAPMSKNNPKDKK